MPRVPEDIGVQPTALPDTYVPAPTKTGLGDIGRGLMHAGAVSQQLLTDELKKQNAAAITKAMSRFREAITEKLYHPETGAITTLKGEKAIGSAGKTRTDLSALRDSIIGKELFTEDAKRVFEAKADEMMDGATRQLDSHEAQESRTAALATVDALQDQNLIALSNSYSDPVTRDKLLKEPEASIRLQALSVEQGEAAVMAWKQKANLAVLSGYVNGRDYLGAKAYFMQVQDTLGPAKTQVKNMLDGLDRDVQAEGLALKLRDFSKGDDPEGWVNNPAVAYAQLEKMKFDDPKMKEEVRQHLNQLMGQEHANQKAQIKQFWDLALGKWNMTHRINTIPQSVQTWLNYRAPELWQKMLSDNEMYWRRMRQDNRESRQMQNYDNATAENYFLGLSIADQASEDITQWAAGRHLDEKGMSILAKRQGQAREKQKNGTDLGAEAFVAGGFAFAPNVPPNSEQSRNLRAELINEFNAFYARAQRQPSAEESKKMWGHVTSLKSNDTSIYNPLDWFEDDETYEFDRRREAGEVPNLDYMMQQPERGKTVIETILLDGKLYQTYSDGSKEIVPAPTGLVSPNANP